MKFIANENIPMTVITTLRLQGHDVLSVKESMRAASDVTILSLSQRESRIVVTQDKDFGELAYRWQLPSSCGIILFRLSGKTPDADKNRMIQVIQNRNDWIGHFSVIQDEKIRMRSL